MKKIILLLILLTSINIYSQTDGMSYQALILNPNLEMPGVNDSTNIYPNKNLEVVFSIIDSEGSIEYRETHNTSTDNYGMINLIIGFGSSEIGSYNNISWDGSPKDLVVDIDLGDGLVELSSQPLLFTPYAYHREIIATGNSDLLGTLDVGGDAFFASDVLIEGDLITVGDDIVDGDLNVLGDTDLDSNLNVDGNSNLLGTLDVGGDAVFASDVLIEGDLITVGDDIVDGDLNVLGDTDLDSNLNVDGNSVLVGSLNTQGDADLDSNLNVDGDTHIHGNLVVEGETTLNDTLSVNSYVKIYNSSYTEDDASINDKIIVYGKSILHDTVIAMSDAKIQKNLEVYEKSVFRDSVNAISHVKIEGNSLLVGTLNTQGDTDLDSDLNVDGNSVLVGTLNTQGDTDLDSDLNVDGNTTIGEDLVVMGDINVSGDVNTVGDDVVDGDFHVEGDTQLDSDLVVDGFTNLKDNLVVEGNSMINGVLTVNANAQLNNNLNVTGNSSLTGTLDVTSNTQLNGALNVVGNTQFTANVHSLTSNQIDGNLTVGTDTSLQGDLNVQGNTTVQDLLVNGVLTTVGGIVDEGDLYVGGDEEVEGNLTIDSDLTVLHDTELKDSLTVHEFAQFNKDIKVMNDLSVDGNTTIVGSTNLNGNLNVSDSIISVLNGKVALGKNDNLTEAVNITGQTTINFNSLTEIDEGADPPFDFLTHIGEATNMAADALLPYLENIIPNPNDGSAYANWYNQRLESLYNATDTTTFALKVKTKQNGIVVVADVDVPNAKQSFVQFNNKAGRPYGSIRGYDPSLSDAYLKPEVIFKNAFSLYSIYKKASKYFEVNALLGQCSFEEALATGIGTMSSFQGQGGIVEGAGTGSGSIVSGGGFGTGVGNGVGGGAIEGVAEVVGVAEGVGVAAVEAAGPVEGGAEVDVEVNTEVTVTEITGEVETEVVITEGEVSLVIDELTTDVEIEFENVQVSCTNTTSLKSVFWIALQTALFKTGFYNAMTLPMHAHPGVTYSSGFADYAEWIERENIYEIMYPGDIVAVNGGLITKNISDKYNQLLVISTNPAILGNIPEIHKQHLYEKVAFMGQIPVKVRGSVNKGDFIVHSELNDGSGIAISPEDIKANQYKKIVGVAWQEKYGNEIGYINMSIGLNANSLTRLAENHENRIVQLENNIRSIHHRLSKIENKENIIPIEKFDLSIDRDLNNSISISNNSKYREIHHDTFENWKQHLIESLENNLLVGKKKEAALVYLNDVKFQKAFKKRINELYINHMNEFHPHSHD